MAEKRMLSKRVTGSRKVNSLSIRAALLWTWALPFFDRDGYIEAEPDFLKDNVVRRRNDIQEDDIQGLVDEIVNSKLWISYHDEEGKRVAKDPKFKEFQRIEYKKEAPSLWEGKKLTADNSPSPRRQLADNSPQDKIKGKESSEEERKGKEKEQNDYDAFFKKYEKTFKEIDQIRIKIQILRIWDKCETWVRMKLQLKQHPEAILLALKRVLEEKPKIPELYAEKIVSVESGNFFESDHTEAVNKFKSEPAQVGNILKSLVNKT